MILLLEFLVKHPQFQLMVAPALFHCLAASLKMLEFKGFLGFLNLSYRKAHQSWQENLAKPYPNCFAKFSEVLFVRNLLHHDYFVRNEAKFTGHHKFEGQPLLSPCIVSQ